MNDETSTTPARGRRGYAVIDQADQVDVTSYDSFPASDPPSWIATGIGSPHLQEAAGQDSTRALGGQETHQSLDALERRGSDQASTLSAVREHDIEHLWRGRKLQVPRPDGFECPDDHIGNRALEDRVPLAREFCVYLLPVAT